MIYRELGSTKMKVSEIGLGCEGFIGKDDDFTKELFEIAIENGVNCMDLYSPNPDLHSKLGKALRGKRENFIMQAHLCTIWQNGQYKATRNIDEVKSSFNDLLVRLETSYIDVGMIHYVDSLQTWKEISEGKIMEYAQQLKASGKIRSIGLSSHNPIAALEAVKSGLIDVLMFSINPCYDLLPGNENCETLWAEDSYKGQLLNIEPERKKLYELCLSMGVGITVMKAFGGGDLLSENSPAGKALTPSQCIHYALTRPAVSSVFVGVHSVEQLKESLAFEYMDDSEKDYASALASFPKISWQGHCMYCGHCAPCPKGIDIAMVTKLLNLTKAQGFVPETVREHYAALTYNASDCIECGKCEERCPFDVQVCKNMKEAKSIFGK